MQTKPTDEIKCRTKNRIYREYRGVKYWLWEKRDPYCSQKGGRQSFLHRVVWSDYNGNINGTDEVVPVGSWRDMAVDNWYSRKKMSGRNPPSIHPIQLFDGRRFHFKPNGYYKLPHEQGGDYMHRYVWAKFNGVIKKGYHIHHKDGDKTNNHISNLEIMSASDHSKLHAKTNKWVGSEENKAQLREASKKSAIIPGS